MQLNLVALGKPRPLDVPDNTQVHTYIHISFHCMSACLHLHIDERDE